MAQCQRGLFWCFFILVVVISAWFALSPRRTRHLAIPKAQQSSPRQAALLRVHLDGQNGRPPPPPKPTTAPSELPTPQPTMKMEQRDPAIDVDVEERNAVEEKKAREAATTAAKWEKIARARQIATDAAEEDFARAVRDAAAAESGGRAPCDVIGFPAGIADWAHDRTTDVCTCALTDTGVVPWGEAGRACRRRGARLCSEAELLGSVGTANYGPRRPHGCGVADGTTRRPLFFWTRTQCEGRRGAHRVVTAKAGARKALCGEVGVVIAGAHAQCCAARRTTRIQAREKQNKKCDRIKKQDRGHAYYCCPKRSLTIPCIC